MVARAVTKVWRDSLSNAPSIGRVHQPVPADEASPDLPMGWRRPETARAARLAAPEAAHAAHLISDDDEASDPEIRVATGDRIVPKRRGTTPEAAPSESLWTSHEFWMGIVLGAAIVLVIKTMLAVRAPFGVDWYVL